MEALRTAANKVVGTKQVTRALKAGKAARAYVANDADTFIFQQDCPLGLAKWENSLSIQILFLISPERGDGR